MPVFNFLKQVHTYLSSTLSVNSVSYPALCKELRQHAVVWVHDHIKVYRRKDGSFVVDDSLFHIYSPKVQVTPVQQQQARCGCDDDTHHNCYPGESSSTEPSTSSGTENSGTDSTNKGFCKLCGGMPPANLPFSHRKFGDDHDLKSFAFPFDFFGAKHKLHAWVSKEGEVFLDEAQIAFLRDDLAFKNVSEEYELISLLKILESYFLFDAVLLQLFERSDEGLDEHSCVLTVDTVNFTVNLRNGMIEVASLDKIFRGSLLVVSTGSFGWLELSKTTYKYVSILKIRDLVKEDRAFFEKIYVYFLKASRVNLTPVMQVTPVQQQQACCNQPCCECENSCQPYDPDEEFPYDPRQDCYHKEFKFQFYGTTYELDAYIRKPTLRDEYPHEEVFLDQSQILELRKDFYFSPYRDGSRSYHKELVLYQDIMDGYNSILAILSSIEELFVYINDSEPRVFETVFKKTVTVDVTVLSKSSCTWIERESFQELLDVYQVVGTGIDGMMMYHLPVGNISISGETYLKIDHVRKNLIKERTFFENIYLSFLKSCVVLNERVLESSSQPTPSQQQQACSCHQQHQHQQVDRVVPPIFDFEYIPVEGQQSFKLKATLIDTQLWVSKKDFERVMDFSVCSLASLGKLEQEVDGEMFINMDVFFKNPQRRYSPKRAQNFHLFLEKMREQLGGINGGV